MATNFKGVSVDMYGLTDTLITHADTLSVQNILQCATIILLDIGILRLENNMLTL